MRDYTDRFFLYKTNMDGALTALIYNSFDLSPVTVIVDADLTSSFPSYHLIVSHIAGTHLRGTAPQSGFSGDHGATWQVAAITSAITAVAIISTEHLGRLVACYYHEDAGAADPYDTGWYVQVGKLANNGDFTWSNPPVSMGIADADKYADLLCREDGVLQFTYINTGGSPIIKWCHSLSLTGVGTWDN